MEINKSLTGSLMYCVSQEMGRERDLYQFSPDIPFPAPFDLT